MSTTTLGQWIIVARSGGAALPLIDASIFLEAPMQVSDSVLGVGNCSIQQASCGKTFGYNHVLVCSPSSLTWRLEVWGGTPWKLLTQRNALIEYLNISDLTQNLIEFNMTDTGNLFQADMQIRTIDDVLLYEGKMDVGGAYADDLLSSYVTFAGAGNAEGTGTIATFSQLSAKVSYQSEESVVIDLAAYPYPYAAPPRFFSSNEGGNAAQTLQLAQPDQVSVTIAPGSWIH